MQRYTPEVLLGPLTMALIERKSPDWVALKEEIVSEILDVDPRARVWP